MDALNQLSVLTRNHRVQIVVVAGVSFAGGFVLAKKLLTEQIETKWSEISQKEILEAKQFYKSGEFADPVEMVKEKYAEEFDEGLADLTTVIRDLKYISDDDLEHEEQRLDERATRQARRVEDRVVVSSDVASIKTDSPLVNNEPLEPVQQAVEDRIREEEIEDTRRSIWDNVTSDIDEVTQLERKQEGKPYIVSEADHMAGGGVGYETMHLTYFEPNNLLITEADSAVENVEKLVGSVNLAKFGHGSMDEDMVYIRNDEYELDIEITRTHRSYEEETDSRASDE